MLLIPGRGQAGAWIGRRVRGPERSGGQAEAPIGSRSALATVARQVVGRQGVGAGAVRRAVRGQSAKRPFSAFPSLRPKVAGVRAEDLALSLTPPACHG